MYENYTRQALPQKGYRELLGSALSVFNSNNAFVIENILRTDSQNYDWYELIDRTSGQLKKPIKRTITEKSGEEIADLFKKIVDKRNRIIHSFQITNEDDEQILATKDRNNKQFHITEEYLLTFIKDNEQLSGLLHEFRGS